MRTSARRSLVALAALASAPAWPGCSAKEQTEYVAGISTQVRVPRDLTSVGVSVSVDGIVTFCRTYRAYNGVVQLPRSLGAYALNDPELAGVVTYTVIGYSSDQADADFDSCRNANVGDDLDTRIIRRSRQPYVPGKILFLPMPLKYSCFDKTDCDDPEKTCKAGRCVAADILPETLPEYTPDLLDGTGGACFSLAQCLNPATALPAVLVDAATCTYAVPNTPSEPPLLSPDPDDDPLPDDVFPSRGEGVNVLVTYDGGLNREVLDKDEIAPNDPAGPESGEGFTTPDPAYPQRFTLAPGLCDMVKGVDQEGNPTPHRITAIHASDACRAKSRFQPICAGDQLGLMGDGQPGAGEGTVTCVSRELTPPPSSLMVVVDNTTGHQAFFDDAQAQAINVSLDDPAFTRTSLGLVYAPGELVCSVNSVAVPSQASREAKGKIADNFGQTKGNLLDVTPAFEGALTAAYAEVAKTPDAFKRAVLVFGNGNFNPPGQAPQCGASAGPAALAQAAKGGPSGIDTYVLLLTGAPGEGDAAKAEAKRQGDEVALAGGTAVATDARSDKSQAKELFQKLVESLATCVYDVEERPASGAPTKGFVNPPNAQTSVLSYVDPVLSKKYVIAPNAACNAEGVPGDGWGYGESPRAGVKRIFLCANSCTNYRAVLNDASLFNLAFAKPSPPVPIFAHPAGCGPEPDPDP